MITANNLSKYLLKQLKRNCPVDTGNLQNNGIFESQSNKTSATILVGTKAAPYAKYTETRSHKPGWQKKSKKEFEMMLIRTYNAQKV